MSCFGPLCSACVALACGSGICQVDMSGVGCRPGSSFRTTSHSLFSGAQGFRAVVTHYECMPKQWAANGWNHRERYCNARLDFVLKRLIPVTAWLLSGQSLPLEDLRNALDADRAERRQAHHDSRHLLILKPGKSFVFLAGIRQASRNVARGHGWPRCATPCLGAAWLSKSLNICQRLLCFMSCLAWQL